MKNNWQERFRKELIDYVNASIVYMEVSKDRNSINFEEEMEWIISWFEKELNDPQNL